MFVVMINSCYTETLDVISSNGCLKVSIETAEENIYGEAVFSSKNLHFPPFDRIKSLFWKIYIPKYRFL